MYWTPRVLSSHIGAWTCQYSGLIKNDVGVAYMSLWDPQIFTTLRVNSRCVVPSDLAVLPSLWYSLLPIVSHFLTRVLLGKNLIILMYLFILLLYTIGGRSLSLTRYLPYILHYTIYYIFTNTSSFTYLYINYNELFFKIHFYSNCSIRKI